MAGSYGVGAAASLNVDLRKKPEQAVRASFALASGWLALSDLSIARCEMTFLVWVHTGFSHPCAHRFSRRASGNNSAQRVIRRLRFAGQAGEGIGEALAADLTAISSAAGVRYLIQRSPFGIARMSSASGSSAFFSLSSGWRRFLRRACRGARNPGRCSGDEPMSP